MNFLPTFLPNNEKKPPNKLFRLYHLCFKPFVHEQTLHILVFMKICHILNIILFRFEWCNLNPTYYDRAYSSEKWRRDYLAMFLLWMGPIDESSKKSNIQLRNKVHIQRENHLENGTTMLQFCVKINVRRNGCCGTIHTQHCRLFNCTSFKP